MHRTSRRTFVKGLAATGLLGGLGLWRAPAWALAGPGQQNLLAGDSFDLFIGETPVKIALSEGQEQDHHFPVEGTLTLSQVRFVDMEADFWVNRFGDDGFLAGSQHIRQGTRLKNGELTYLDHPSLGILIKVVPVGARPAAPNPMEMEEQQAPADAPPVELSLIHI